MARTGNFGRQPRTATSLTNTMVALAREWQQQRAQNIMDAWQKGGMFEGKKATDEAVLAFWKGRIEGISKDDPLFDTYSNTVKQLDYTIKESKMTADYAQGKKSDAQMVAFYMGWTKKVPKNSEFYRVLQRDAGQYMRNQRAQSEAAARQAAEERYQSQQNNTRKTMEAPGEYAIDVLRRVAQSGNANLGIAGLISAPGSGSDLTDFDIAHPGTMLKLMDVIARDNSTMVGGDAVNVEAAGSSQVLYHDDDGKPWTGKAIIAEFQKLDPNFKPGTPFNVDYVSGLLDRQVRGVSERIERANKTGHMTDVASLTKTKGYVAMLGRQVKAYPVQKAYQDARADRDAVIRDKTSSPQAILNAQQKYLSTLADLEDDPSIQTNDAMRSMIAAEIEGDASSPTLNETFTGLAGGDFAGQARDNAENIANFEFMQAQVDAVANGEAVWTYGETDSNGVFVPTAGGKTIGAATPEAVEAGGANAQVIVVPDPRGGVPLKMAVTALPIYAVARNPITGEPLKAENSQPIGYAYDLPSGGMTKTVYGFQTKQGFKFSENPPWADNLKPKGVRSDGQARLEVDFTPVLENAPNMLGGKDPLTGAYKSAISVAGAADFGNGFKVKPGRSAKAEGSLVFNPQDVAAYSDDRDRAGIDPTSDFDSLTLASLLADPEGMGILSNLDKNPAFKSQMEADAYTVAGVERDPKTGAWVPGTGDQARLSSSLRQQNIVTNAKSFMDFVTGAINTWSRATTQSPYMRPEKPAGLDSKGFDLGKLATDLVSDTPFAALGNVFTSGGTIKPPAAQAGQQGSIAIKPGAAIKVPTIGTQPVAPIALNTKDYALPTAPPQTGSTAPTQTGSTAPTKRDGTTTNTWGGGR